MTSDPQFNDYLRQHSDLSDLYRQGAAEEPSRELDTQILSESRKHVVPQPGTSSGEFLRGVFQLKYWPAATAMVAVVLVTVAVNIQVPMPEPGVIHNSPPGKVQQIPTTELPETDRRQPTHTTGSTLPPATDAQALKAGIPIVTIKAPSGTADPEPAEIWLQKIEQQLADGRQEDARKLYYAFRELYPGKKIPDGLLSRLGM